MIKRANISLFRIFTSAADFSWAHWTSLLPIALIMTFAAMVLSGYQEPAQDPFWLLLHHLGIPVLDQLQEPALWILIPLTVLFIAVALVSFFILGLRYRDITLNHEATWYSHLSEVPLKVLRSVTVTILIGIVSFVLSVVIAFITTDSIALSAQSVSFFGLLLISISTVMSIYLIYFILRFSLYTAAIILDNAGIIESLKRSYAISKGWRQWSGTGILFFIQQLVLMVIGFCILWLWLKWVPEAANEFPVPTFHFSHLLYWIAELIVTAIVSLWSIVSFLKWYEELKQRQLAETIMTREPEA